MKSKSVYYILIGSLFALLLSVSWSIVGFTINNMENQNLSFKAKANKEVYLLGEAVQVEFAFFNKGDGMMK